MWFTRSSDAAINWAKKFTDWHEDFSPNEGLARAMDLHNNKMGRDFFKDNLGIKVNAFITLLLNDLDKAVKIDKVSSIEGISDHMVYIEDS